MVIPKNDPLFIDDGRPFQAKMLDYIERHWGVKVAILDHAPAVAAYGNRIAARRLPERVRTEMSAEIMACRSSSMTISRQGASA
jgi:hypothetical protein